MQANQNNSPASRPVPMNLFPTLDNLESVLELGLSQLPILTPNALVSILMTYHNTLLHVQHKCDQQGQP